MPLPAALGHRLTIGSPRLHCSRGQLQTSPIGGEATVNPTHWYAEIVERPLDIPAKTGDASWMGVGVEGEPEQIEPDPRESPFELPPVECGPFADGTRKTRAFRAVIEQAEYERTSAPASQQPDPER